MKAVFQDMQDESNPRNGTQVSDPGSLHELFQSLKGRQPFGFLLVGDDGTALTIGLADDCATVQHSSSEGLPPYLMAVSNDAVDDDGFVEFLAGGTPTPIPRRFCLPIERAENIVADFLEHGRRSEAIAWDEV